jgi:hypothetical protein
MTYILKLAHLAELEERKRCVAILSVHNESTSDADGNISSGDPIDVATAFRSFS